MQGSARRGYEQSGGGVGSDSSMQGMTVVDVVRRLRGLRMGVSECAAMVVGSLKL